MDRISSSPITTLGAEQGAGGPIAAGTSLGAVSLTVSDLARSRRFYERVLGLHSSEMDDGGLAFSATPVPAGGSRGALVELHGDPAAAPLDRRATGLFHLAILLPSRADLGHALLRLAQEQWPLDGASDHLVSEAVYLSDPDGNGIEIYRDRPRDQWRYDDGQLQMSTLALDLRAIVAELGSGAEPAATVPSATIMGHVHLQVADLAAAEAFYHGVLGFDVTVREYPGALFVSAGGYHHHLGLNTWNSAGSDAPVPGALGLRSYQLLLPDAAELELLLDRVRASGLVTAVDGVRGHALRDPSGNLVLLRCR